MSDTIQFTCTECSHTMQLPAATEGRQGKCPSCAAVVTVTNNGMVDLASLQQQHIRLQQPEPSPTHPVQQQSDVQQPAATKDVPLEMGTTTFAKGNLTAGETILHAGRFYPFYVMIFKAQNWALLLCVLGGLGYMIYDYYEFFDDRWGAFKDDLLSLGGEVFPIRDPLLVLQFAVVFALAGVGILFCLWVEYRWAYNKDQKTEFVLTNQRLIAKWGFLRTVIREIRLDKIESVNYGQTLYERWFGIGRLTVKGTGGGKVGKFKYLLDALEFRRRILAQIDRVKT